MADTPNGLSGLTDREREEKIRDLEGQLEFIGADQFRLAADLKEKLENELAVLKFDQESRQAQAASRTSAQNQENNLPQISGHFPLSPQRTETSLSHQEYVRPLTNLSDNLHGPGFGAYANSHNTAFGALPTSDGHFDPQQNQQPQLQTLDGPDWSFPALSVDQMGQRDGHTGSGVATPDASSGSAPTPDESSISSSPPIPPDISQQSRKRARESVDRWNLGQPPKNMRHTPSPAVTRPDTPSSRDSLDGVSSIPDDLAALLGGDPREEMRRMAREEKLMAARKERERLDEQFARSLQEQFNAGNDDFMPPPPPSYAPGTSASHRNTMHDFLGSSSNNNRRHDPVQPHHSHTSSRPSYLDNAGSNTSFLSNNNQYRLPPMNFSPFQSNNKPENSPAKQHIKPELSVPRSNPSAPASRRSRGEFVDLGSDSESDDLAVTDGRDFVPSKRSSFKHTALHGVRPADQNAIWNNRENIPAADLTGSSPIAQRYRHATQAQNLPPPVPPQWGNARNPVLPSTHSHPSSRFDPIRRGLSSAASAVYGILDNTISSVGQVSNGFSQGYGSGSSQNTAYWRRGMDLPSVQGTGLSNNPYNIDLYDQIRGTNSYYDPLKDYMPADPAKTAEELRSLMNNIRPDEELGASDRTGSPEDMAEGCGLYEHQVLGLAWMTKMEEGSNGGGILADDMGLGKTIQAIALMISRRSENPSCKTNLIVAPVALLRQWESEIKVKVKPGKRLSTYLYHGTKKNTTWKNLKQYDVVLTTYGTLAAEKGRKDKVDLQKKANPNWAPSSAQDKLPLLGDECKFYRVFLDEAQNIKNKNTKSAHATYALQAEKRFCMTGTPMMNNVGELFSLIHFLRIRPYCVWERFNIEFVRPLKAESNTMTEDAMKKLQALLKAILLRRTKKSKINDKPIIELKERTTVIDHAIFDNDQMEFYRNLETQTQNRFNRYVKAGTVGKNYSNALVLLLRLRQACCHPHLIRDYAQDEGGNPDLTPEDLESIAKELGPDVVRRIREDGMVDCPICMDAPENATIFIPCGHATCSECFARLADGTQVADEGAGNPDGKTFKCMSCRGPVNPKKVTNWNTFKKVHMADMQPEEGLLDIDLQVNIEAEEGSDSDSEDSDSESEDEDSDLGGFIVDDEDPIKDDEVEDEDLLVPGLKAEEDTPRALTVKGGKLKQNGKASKRGKKKKAKGQCNGKGKAKKEKKKRKTLAELQKDGRRNIKAREKYLKRLRKDWVTSAKIDKCVEILADIQAKEGHEKTIVFSQFTTLLDLLEVPMIERGWDYKRYDGSMSAVHRNDAVIEFTGQARCKIMLVSLKAGNAGLNLTAANNVILFDPFWNPYIEEQAIDRAHRIGQRREVFVHRLLVENTVEDRIVELQERKRAMIEGALDETASQNIARLGVRELAFLFGVQHN